MCKGEQVYFYCPRSLVGDQRCPYYNRYAATPFTYYMVLSRNTQWICCGNCISDCMECVNLDLSSRIMDNVECDNCLQRIEAERQAARLNTVPLAEGLGDAGEGLETAGEEPEGEPEGEASAEASVRSTAP